MVDDYTDVMRTFSLLFVFIALVVLAMFLIYVIRGPVEPLIIAGLFVSFLACAVPALFLLKPFEPPEELKRRREERERRRSSSGEPRDPGS
jgi:L-lactate permease